MYDEKHKTEEWLCEQFREKDRDVNDIAKEVGVSSTTISRWIDNHELIRKRHDEELLKEKYLKENETLVEIANEIGCSQSPVRKTLKEAGVEMKTRSDYALPSLHVRPSGHVYISETLNRETSQVQLHRLTAIAEYGWEEVTQEDTVVHHKNCIPWDNRPSNLEVMQRDEHTRLHDNPRRLRSLDPEWSQYELIRTD